MIYIMVDSSVDCDSYNPNIEKAQGRLVGFEAEPFQILGLRSSI